MKHHWIDNNASLASWCANVAGIDYLIIDTEFVRERSYFPELCLVQLKHGDALACVDAIAVNDLSPLLALMHEPTITKVFHAADQDLEIFYLLSDQRVPAPLFDTQLAAPLLGHDEQIGYARLVQERLGIELAKTQSRTDWSRRPLSDAQIDYALDDVIHLETLYLAMREELQRLDRLNWLEPEFRRLATADRFETPDTDRWLRVKQVSRYKGDALAALQALATWREQQARERNKPRNWVLKDDVLTQLAQQRPADLNALDQLRGLDERTRKRDGRELIEVIDSARGTKPAPLPPRSKRDKPSAERLATIQLLNAMVHQLAADHDIAPGTLASTTLLERIAGGEGRSVLSGSWRDKLIGDALQGLLDGTHRLGTVAKRDGVGLYPAD